MLRKKKDYQERHRRDIDWISLTPSEEPAAELSHIQESLGSYRFDDQIFQRLNQESFEHTIQAEE